MGSRECREEGKGYPGWEVSPGHKSTEVLCQRRTRDVGSSRLQLLQKFLPIINELAMERKDAIRPAALGFIFALYPFGYISHVYPHVGWVWKRHTTPHLSASHPKAGQEDVAAR